MIKCLQKFERIVVGLLILMLAAVYVSKSPVFIIDVNDLLGIFGFILLVIIGLAQVGDSIVKGALK